MPTVSVQVTQGAVGFAGFIVPAATRGSSAFAPGLLFSEHACSAAALAAQVVAASRTAFPLFPITCQWKPPSTPAPLSLSALAANTRSLLASPPGPGLVPDDPRHGVVRAGERDVRLDPVAVDVDVQAGIEVP